MCSPYLMGIDLGTTFVKSVIFDKSGKEVAKAECKAPTAYPAEGWVERDLVVYWNCVKKVIHKAINKSEIKPDQIVGVGVTGHGGGLYVLDKEGAPVRNGILSLDTRANSLIKSWRKNGVMAEIFSISRQNLLASEPVTLLSWLKQTEPDRYKKINSILSCKDFIKYRLSGVLCTDETDASPNLFDVRERTYSNKVLELLNLEECKEKLPPIILGWKTCGEVTAEAAKATGLAEHTPVASGLWDIDATALGSGCLEQGQLMIIVGTWAVVEVVLNRPLLNSGKELLTTCYGAPNRWLLMASSPTSTTNLDWFMDQCCRDLCLKAIRDTVSPYALCDEEVARVPIGSGGVIFHPFLYGLPSNPSVRAGFYGITGWHTRAYLLRALYEGVVFSIYTHAKRIENRVEIRDARIAGGGTKSDVWNQMLADTLGYVLKLPNGTELGAHGAAMCAGIAVNLFKDHQEAIHETVSISREYTPVEKNTRKYLMVYKAYAKMIENVSGS